MHQSPAKVVPLSHRSLGWQIQEMDAVLELTRVMIKEIQSRQWERVAAIQEERDRRLRVCLENLENIENSSEAREKIWALLQQNQAVINEVDLARKQLKDERRQNKRNYQAAAAYLGRF
tara:strand:- start:96 stop:452 length:357 start_codon:yes stop_codon:yes gene_type:complete